MNILINSVKEANGVKITVSTNKSWYAADTTGNGPNNSLFANHIECPTPNSVPPTAKRIASENRNKVKHFAYKIT